MKIFTQMPLIMNDVSAVKKDKSGQGLNYKYRGIDDFMNALNPVMAKHGVCLSSKVLDKKSEIFEISKVYNGQTQVQKWVSVNIHMEYVFYAQDGSSLKFETIGEGRDNSDKAHNKAMAAALKYALMQAFLIPTEDIVDQDSERPELVSESKSAQNTVQKVQKPDPIKIDLEPPLFDASEKIDEKKEIVKKTDVLVKNYADQINLDHLAKFKFESGIYSGKLLGDLKISDIKNYLTRLEKVKAGGATDPQVTTMILKLTDYLLLYERVKGV